MLCEKCKIREATIQYTEVVDGVMTEHNFCTQCAKSLDFGQYSNIFDSDFPLGKLLSSLLAVGDSSQKEAKMAQVVCPTCKTSYGEFVKNSQFGCQDCYEVFDLFISDNIKQLQGSDSHKGKRPKYQPAKMEAPSEVKEKKENDSPADQVALLDRRLKAAVDREDYETAAMLRDKIREIKAGEVGNA